VVIPAADASYTKIVNNGVTTDALGLIPSGTSLEWTAKTGGEYFFRVRAIAALGKSPDVLCNIVNNVTTGKILKVSGEPDAPVVWDPSATGNKTS
jgi:hypothetical protein